MSFRSARRMAGLSGSQVAKAMGVSITTVYAWENGRACPKVEHLLRLRDLYDCTADEMLNGNTTVTDRESNKTDDDEERWAD